MEPFLTTEELDFISREIASPRGKRRMFLESLGRALFTALAILLALLVAVGIGAILYAALAHLILGMKAVKPSAETSAAVRTALYWGLAVYFGGALTVGIARFRRTARLFTTPSYSDWGPRTVVTFTSTRFNMTESREYYVNPECFGDDVAVWFIGELVKRGEPVASSPGPEDFGWYVTFGEASRPSCFVISSLVDAEGRFLWFCEVERRFGFRKSIAGARRVDEEAVELVHEVLSQDAEIADIRWHYRDISIPGRTGKRTPR